MAIYVAFSDETQVAGKDSEFIVAGYVARESDWLDFARAWQERVLDGPPFIPYLHMTESRSAEWREAQGIRQHQADERVSEAVRIIRSMGNMLPFWSSLPLDIFRRVYQPHGRIRRDHFSFRDPDYVCFLAFVMQVVFFVKRHCPDVQHIDFITESKYSISKNLPEVIRELRRLLSDQDPSLAAILGDVTSASSERQIPLQAADVFCWHIQRKYFRERNPETKFDASEIRRLGSLLSAPFYSERLDERLLQAMYDSTKPP